MREPTTRSIAIQLRLTVAVVTGSALVGCSGLIGEPGQPVDPDAPNPPSTHADGGGLPPSPSCDAPSVGATPMRRLTNAQYANAVHDLFAPADVTVPIETFAADTKVGGFDSNLMVPISEAQFERYAAAAESIATQLATDLPGLAGCGSLDRACAATYLRELGKRAYRRPLTDEEHARLLTLVDLGADGGDLTHGLGLALRAMLQSPHFLYIVEAGASPSAPGEMVPVGAYELAARLSFFLWGSIPDDALFAAADAGILVEEGEIEAQARRMLDDPRAHTTIASFHDQWLGLDELSSLEKDPTVFPEYTTGIRSRMEGETSRFASYVITRGDARLETLLTASFTFLDGGLYDLYGVTAPASPDETFMGWPRVDLPPGERSGLLTHASFLAVHAHPDQTTPVFRGAVIRERFFCQSLPPPPPTVNDNPPGLDPSLSTRERFAQHREDPACSPCHQLMDPIGLGFESYDAIGRFRTTEAGRPIDDRGEIVQTLDADGEFEGALELGVRLSESEEVGRCVSSSWTRFALGRLETDTDACSTEEVFRTFADSGHDVRELIVAITRSTAFRHRAVAAPTAEEE